MDGPFRQTVQFLLLDRLLTFLEDVQSFPIEPYTFGF